MLGDFTVAIGNASAAFGLRTSPSASLRLRLKTLTQAYPDAGPERATTAGGMGPIGQ
jgi:hypothetical protein